jgi:hypothetical protein
VSAGNSQRGLGSVIELTSCLEALLPLEHDQSLLGTRSEHAIGLTHVEPLLVQQELHLPDFLDIHSRADRHRASFAGAKLGAGGAHGHDGDYLVTVIHNHDLVAHHEIHISAPFGIDGNQRLGNFHNADAGRDDGPNGK